jgi:hypothetical protein
MRVTPPGPRSCPRRRREEVAPPPSAGFWCERPSRTQSRGTCAASRRRTADRAPPPGGPPRSSASSKRSGEALRPAWTTRRLQLRRQQRQRQREAASLHRQAQLVDRRRQEHAPGRGCRGGGKPSHRDVESRRSRQNGSSEGRARRSSGKPRTHAARARRARTPLTIQSACYRRSLHLGTSLGVCPGWPSLPVSEQTGGSSA